MKEDVFDRYKKIKNYSEFTPFTPRALIFKAVGSDNVIDFKRAKYWYINVNNDKTITFQNATLGEIYVLKIKIEEEKTITLPDSIKYPEGLSFGNKVGITYMQLLYTTENYTDYYFDVLSLIEGIGR